MADRTGHSLVDIYGVATFYKSFSLEPRGRHLVSVCMGTACHVRGAPRVLDEFEKTLEIKAGQTTPDRDFSLTTVNCLGACADSTSGGTHEAMWQLRSLPGRSEPSAVARVPASATRGERALSARRGARGHLSRERL